MKSGERKEGRKTAARETFMNTVEKRSRDRGDKVKRGLVPSATINGRIVGKENGKIYNSLPFPSPVPLIPSYFRGVKVGEGSYILYFSPRKSRDSRATIRSRGGEKGEGENRWTDKGGSVCRV